MTNTEYLNTISAPCSNVTENAKEHVIKEEVVGEVDDGSDLMEVSRKSTARTIA